MAKEPAALPRARKVPVDRVASHDDRRDLPGRSAAPPVTKTDDVAGYPDPFGPASGKVSSTWSDLAGVWQGSTVSKGPKTRTPFVDNRRGPGVGRREDPGPREVAARDESVKNIETCRYDTKRRQLIDFRLPDLNGKAVSLKDFDADLILIDFWGTWCRPCLNSVPHMVELQKRMGPRKLAIVGVACEEGPPPTSSAHVADVAKRLGVNYTILVSSKDGASPLQDALSVQTFPTMVLLDRQGRVVWRDQGTAPITLARLDRVLDTTARAANVDRVRR